MIFLSQMDLSTPTVGHLPDLPFTYLNRPLRRRPVRDPPEPLVLENPGTPPPKHRRAHISDWPRLLAKGLSRFPPSRIPRLKSSTRRSPFLLAASSTAFSQHPLFPADKTQAGARVFPLPFSTITPPPPFEPILPLSRRFSDKAMSIFLDCRKADPPQNESFPPMPPQLGAFHPSTRFNALPSLAKTPRAFFQTENDPPPMLALTAFRYSFPNECFCFLLRFRVCCFPVRRCSPMSALVFTNGPKLIPPLASDVCLPPFFF